MPHHHWLTGLAAAVFIAFILWAAWYLCRDLGRQRQRHRRTCELEGALLASQRERLGREQARLANYQRTLREYGHTSGYFTRQYHADVASTRAAIRDLERRARR